jgi:cysteine synthase
MSLERKRTLTAFGAELVLTDPELRMMAAIAEAERIRDETGAFMPDQFTIRPTPGALRDHRARDLGGNGGPHRRVRLRQRDGRHDLRVGRYLKERLDEVLVVAVEPGRSACCRAKSGANISSRGWAPASFPPTSTARCVDRVMKAWEEDAFPVARRLAREEGLFVGMSSGAIVWAAMEVAKELGEGHRVVCIAPTRRGAT